MLSTLIEKKIPIDLRYLKWSKKKAKVRIHVNKQLKITVNVTKMHVLSDKYFLKKKREKK